MRLFQYVIAVVAICLVPSSTMAQGKQYAVLVGVEKYQHSNLGELEYAVEDVTELADVLIKSGYSVTLLTDDTGKKDKSLEPTQANIEKQIHDVLGKCRRDDTVLIALAGHGLQFTGQKDAFFCPVDARPFDDETDSMVSISKIYSEFEKSFAGVKVIFVDACRNDPDPGRGRGGLDADAAPRPPRGVAALFSCSAGQRAFEHDELKHGVFFHYVLEGLKEKAADSDGEVTFSGLSLYVRKNVPRRIRQLFPNQRYDQFPNLKADLVGIPPVLARVELKPKSSSTPKEMTPQKKPAPENGKLITNGIGMKLALIPAGEFMMGSSIPAEETAALFGTKTAYHTNEHPQHKVKITKPFHMATTEVTQKQWQVVMQSSPWRGLDATKEGADFPATYVSWNDAIVFCEKLTAYEQELKNIGENERYRLPTEAEWEYACRAGSKSLYCFGYDKDVLKQYAWLAENAWKAREAYAHQAGEKKANDFGLFDMHGNVWEWCNDRYTADYYVLTPPADPQGPKTNNNPFARVLRGGSWRSDSQDLRCAVRFRNAPNTRSSGTGFRIVKTIDSLSTKDLSKENQPEHLMASDMPLVVSEEFGPIAKTNWIPGDSTNWAIKKEKDNYFYGLVKRIGKYVPPFRSPFNRSLLKNVYLSNFDFDVSLQSTTKDYNHRDLCLFFGYQDDSHFYYVSLGKKTDAHTNNIFIVNGAPRKNISQTTNSGTNWDANWHHARIVRRVDSGSIEVYFDNMDEPIMTARDKTFEWGQIGVGSFDDTGNFDRIVIRGQTVERK